MTEQFLSYLEHAGSAISLFALVVIVAGFALATGRYVRRWREVMGDKISGIAVHIGARVVGKAGPGEVLVSSTVKDLVAGSGLRFVDHGVHALKGVPGEWRLFAVEH